MFHFGHLKKFSTEKMSVYTAKRIFDLLFFARLHEVIHSKNLKYAPAITFFQRIPSVSTLVRAHV